MTGYLNPHGVDPICVFGGEFISFADCGEDDEFTTADPAAVWRPVEELAVVDDHSGSEDYFLFDSDYAVGEEVVYNDRYAAIAARHDVDADFAEYSYSALYPGDTHATVFYDDGRSYDPDWWRPDYVADKRVTLNGATLTQERIHALRASEQEDNEEEDSWGEDDHFDHLPTQEAISWVKAEQRGELVDGEARQPRRKGKRHRLTRSGHNVRHGRLDTHRQMDHIWLADMTAGGLEEDTLAVFLEYTSWDDGFFPVAPGFWASDRYFNDAARLLKVNGIDEQFALEMGWDEYPSLAEHNREAYEAEQLEQDLLDDLFGHDGIVDDCLFDHSSETNFNDGLGYDDPTYHFDDDYADDDRYYDPWDEEDPTDWYELEFLTIEDFELIEAEERAAEAAAEAAEARFEHLPASRAIGIRAQLAHRVPAIV